MQNSADHVEYLKRAHQKARRRDVRRDTAIELAECLINAQPEVATQYAEDALSLAKKVMTQASLGVNARIHNELVIARAHVVIFYYRKNAPGHENLVIMIRSAIECFERYDEPLRAAKARQKLAYYFFRLGDAVRARELYERDMPYLLEVHEHSAIIASCNGLAQISQQMGDHQGGLAYYSQGLAVAHELNDARYIATIESGIGALFEDMGEFQKSREHYHLALEICDEQTMQQLCAAIHIGLCGVENMAGKYGACIQHCQKALRLYTSANDRFGQCAALELLSGCLLMIGDYAQATSYIATLLQESKELGMQSKQAAAYNLMATAHAKQQNFEQGLICFQEASQLFAAVRDLRGQCYTQANIAQAQLDLGAIVEAHRSISTALEMSTEWAFPDLEVEILPIFCNIALQNGDARQLIPSIEKGLWLSQRIHHKRAEALLLKSLGDIEYSGMNFADSLQRFTSAYNLAADIQDNELMYKCAERISSSYHELGLNEHAYQWHVTYHQTERRVINEGSERLVRALMTNIETERLRWEHECLTQQNKNLRIELDFKQAKLAALALHLAHKNETLENLKHMTSSIVQEYNKDASSLADILVRHIDKNIRDDSAWQEFQEQFSHTHSTFIQRLTERYGRLTPMEIKICSLLKIQLSTKEIASTLVLSSRTIEDHRNRLRKKFNLTKEDNLSTFLLSIE